MGLCNRKNGGVFPDLWQLPGGGVEDKESDLEAICREVAEETGIELDVLNLSIVDDKDSGETTKQLSDGETVIVEMKFIVFYNSIDREHSQIDYSTGTEFSELAWIARQDLSSLAMVPAGLPLFKRLGWINDSN